MCRDLASSVSLGVLVVIPSTSFEPNPSTMRLVDWFGYGTMAIALGTLLIAACVLIVWLIRGLFKP